MIVPAYMLGGLTGWLADNSNAVRWSAKDRTWFWLWRTLTDQAVQAAQAGYPLLQITGVNGDVLVWQAGRGVWPTPWHPTRIVAPTVFVPPTTTDVADSEADLIFELRAVLDRGRVPVTF